MYIAPFPEDTNWIKTFSLNCYLRSLECNRPPTKFISLAAEYAALDNFSQTFGNDVTSY